jgi:hypothetical protein
MLETIATALIIELGRKAIDKFWKSADDNHAPVVTSGGQQGFAAIDDGRTQVRLAAAARTSSEWLFGRFYIPPDVNDQLTGEELALVLVVEEHQQQVLLFVADLDNGYEIELPYGTYSFYAFLVDATVDDLFDALIYAVGLPSQVDLSGFDTFVLEEGTTYFDLVQDVPYDITAGGPFYLDFVMIDPVNVPGFPQFFSELLSAEDEDEEEDAEDWEDDAWFDVTGNWKMKETYRDGQTTAEVHLVQAGCALSGYMIITDTPRRGSPLMIQETVAGDVEDDNIHLMGTGVQVLKGRVANYQLDEWQGVIENDDRITGTSSDASGTSGKFVMRRV